MKIPIDFKNPAPIPLPVPWSRAEWSAMNLEKFREDRRLENFMRAWDIHANREATRTLYIGILWALAGVSSENAGELVRRPDFEVLCKPGPEERWNSEKLVSLLGGAGDLTISKPNFFPGPVEWFDFLIITVDFVVRVCERWPHLKNPRIEEGITRLVAYSTAKLFEVINRSFATTGLN